MSDAVRRGAGQPAFDVEVERDADEVWAPPLTREEATALRRRHPGISPWQVVVAQVGVGALVALVAGALTGAASVATSALYGAATVAVPGALMARGMTSRLSSVSVMGSAVAVLGWALMKMMVSILMLVMAPRVVESLSWPALLAALVLCLQTYWFALLWRGRSKNSTRPIEA